MIRPRTTARPPRRALLALTVGAGLAVAGIPLTGSSALADTGTEPAAGAVFVQLNATTGNQIAAYSRRWDGTLTAAGRYWTGGAGGVALSAPVDSLASQHSLQLDQASQALLAVNAGSDTVTSFSVAGARLHRESLVASGGLFPVSLAVHGSLVYVLNAGGDGSISGLRLIGRRLEPLPGSTRSLGLGNAAVPLFINAPAQVGFSADGRVLVVTTKSHNELLTFPLDATGRPSATPTVTASTDPLPFSFVLDRAGDLEVTEAGTGQIASYALSDDGTVTPLGSSASDGGAALCWNLRIGRTIFGANAGSGTLSSWTIGADGTATLTAPVATTTGAGPIDLAATPDGRTLYTQESDAGTLGVYRVSPNGGLTRLQTVTGLPEFAATGGMEGIAVE